MNYNVVFKPSAAKQFACLSKKNCAKVADKIEVLTVNSAPFGSKKLKGQGNIWRLRFGDFRILYLPPDETGKIVILRVAARDDAYKLL